MKYALMNLLADAAATTATTDAAAATETMGTGATIIYYAVQFVPMILIFVVFYFLLIRPQRKKDKEAKTMLDNLKVGDQKTQMMIARWAVRNVEQLSVTNDSEQLI